MSHPTITVEAAFGVDPLTVPTGGQWTDISAYVSELHGLTGRQAEVDRFEAGSCLMVLDNTDGRFDPDYTSGAYYPDVKPMVRVRVQVTDPVTAAVTDQFTGFVGIDGWVQKFRHPGDAWVEVRLTDLFEPLGRRRIKSPWEYHIESLSPRAWWRFGESSGTVATDRSGNGHHGTFEGGVTFNHRSGLLQHDPDGALEFQVNDHRMVAPKEAGVTGYPFTILAWVNMNSILWAPEDNTLVSFGAQIYEQKNGPLVDVALIDAISLSIVKYNPNNTDGGSTVPESPYDRRLNFIVGTDWAGPNPQRWVYHSTLLHHNRTYFVAAVATSASDFKVYVDAVDGTSVQDAGNPTIKASDEVTVGNFVSGANPTTADLPFDGTIDEVVVINGTALSAAQITEIHNMGREPWGGDTSDERINRVLDKVGVQAGDRSIAAGQSTLEPTGMDETVLSHLKAVAESESGYLYVDHRSSGDLVFRDRHAPLTETRSSTSQATFGDGASDVPYTELVWDVTPVRNEVRVGRRSGATVDVSDATSVADYGPLPYELTGLIHDNDRETKDRANYILDRFKEPHRRVRSVVLEPRKSTSTVWTQALTRRIGDRVTVKRTNVYGSTVTQDCLIEGIRFDWSQRDHAWRTEYFLSPADVRVYWRLGVTGAAELGTNTRLGF